MTESKIIIAIDGYSSTGKSTFAKLIAKGLGYIYADSGALYRAIAYFAFTNGFITGSGEFIDKEALIAVLQNIRLTFKPTGADGSSEIYLNGNNVESDIRTPEVSAMVSHVAEVPAVREYVNIILRRLGADKGLVMDGRDIGTAVFPNAELKLFMTANETVRAKRRYEELKAKGKSVSIDDVLQSIRRRDEIDTTREADPLTKAKDAIELDNSAMTLEEEIEWLNNILGPSFGLHVRA